MGHHLSNRIEEIRKLQSGGGGRCSTLPLPADMHSLRTRSFSCKKPLHVDPIGSLNAMEDICPRHYYTFLFFASKLCHLFSFPHFFPTSLSSTLVCPCAVSNVGGVQFSCLMGKDHRPCDGLEEWVVLEFEALLLNKIVALVFLILWVFLD